MHNLVTRFREGPDHRVAARTTRRRGQPRSGRLVVALRPGPRRRRDRRHADLRLDRHTAGVPRPDRRHAAVSGAVPRRLAGRAEPRCHTGPQPPVRDALHRCECPSGPRSFGPAEWDQRHCPGSASVRDHGYVPTTILDSDLIRNAVALASRAPSLHNTSALAMGRQRPRTPASSRPQQDRAQHRPRWPRGGDRLRRDARPPAHRDGRGRLGVPRRTVPEPERSSRTWPRWSSAARNTSPRRSAAAPTRSCGAGPTGCRSWLRATGTRSSPFCARQWTPTPRGSTCSPTSYGPNSPRRPRSPRLCSASTPDTRPN